MAGGAAAAVTGGSDNRRSVITVLVVLAVGAAWLGDLPGCAPLGTHRLGPWYHGPFGSSFYFFQNGLWCSSSVQCMWSRLSAIRARHRISGTGRRRGSDERLADTRQAVMAGKLVEAVEHLRPGLFHGGGVRSPIPRSRAASRAHPRIA